MPLGTILCLSLIIVIAIFIIKGLGKVLKVAFIIFGIYLLAHIPFIHNMITYIIG